MTGLRNDHDPFGWVGRTIDGKYRVDGVVGEGGFAVVYKAHHLGFDEPIAIKCLKLPKMLAEADRDAFLETFVAEGRLLHKLSKATAGIVQALDVGATEAPSGAWTPYIVLEWLDGITLHRALRERENRGKVGRSIEEAIALLDPAARALAVAHEHNVAHRDVKPANLLFADVGGRPTLKVLDFGIAKVLSETAASKALATGHAMAAFTPRYAAPEQFSRSYGPTGPWTDVFAFALVLVEVVLGRVALGGDEPAQMYLQCCDLATRPTLRTLGVRDVPDELEAVLHKALAVDPRRRYGSLGELWDAVTLAVPDATLARPSERARPLARLTTDLSIALSPLDVHAVGPGTSAAGSGSYDLPPAGARASTSRAAIALGLVAGAAAMAFALYTTAADDQAARLATAAAAGLATSPSPTEPPPPVVKTVAFRVPVATATPMVRVAAQPGVGAFAMDAIDVASADLDACVRTGACPALPSGGAIGSEHAVAYCRHVGKRALTREEVFAALRALDAATFGLRCARVD